MTDQLAAPRAPAPVGAPATASAPLAPPVGAAPLPTVPLPRSPTGRIPRWVLDEALVPAARLAPPRGRGRRALRRPPTRPLGRRLLVTAVAAALVSGAGWTASTGHLDDVTAAASQLRHGVTPGAPDAPTPGFESSDAPLGSPPPTVVPSDRYVLQAPLPAADGAPPAPGSAGAPPAPGSAGGRTGGGRAVVAYDPCRPVHYVVRASGAPPGGDRILAEAVARVSAATGLVFVADGPTDEAPVADRALFQPGRYGDRWAPVLISWATAEEVPALAGDVAGLGGSASVALPDAPQVLVTGVVTLDGPQLGELLQQPGGEALVRSVAMHELGHLVGLEHLDDPTQLMNPTTSPGLTEFAAGDLAGLAVLGRGPCVPEV